MGWVLKESGRDGGEGVGLGLQGRAAPAPDLLRALGQAAEELADRRSDLGRGAEAGVGGLSRGGGTVNFSAQDFMVPSEDLNALAERETARALAMFQTAIPSAAPMAGSVPAGVGGMPGTPAPAPLVPQPAAPLAYLPPRYRMPGAL